MKQGGEVEQGRLYLKQLYLSHLKKREILQKKGSFDEYSQLSEEQKQIIEEGLGLTEIDWDKLVYEKSAHEKKGILNQFLKMKSKQFTDVDEKIVQNILTFLKMYHLLLTEESKTLVEKDHSKLEKELFEQASYLVKIVHTLNTKLKEVKEDVIDQYDFKAINIPITVKILHRSGEFVPIYRLIIAKISKYTEYFLEKIRKELIKQVNLGIVDINDIKKRDVVKERFTEAIVDLINKYFPDIDDETTSFLTTYLIQKSLGLGKVELVMNDPRLEEIAINSAEEPIWAYHRQHGWVKTNIYLDSEDQTKHFASMIGRKVGRQITVLDPLLDANLPTGDRVNATLMPISAKGHTITFRKFATKPFTITDFINQGTLSMKTAAMIWLGIQYELSALIVGGTASGKTSMLNVVANFFPPNQRIITIEDTREIQLPKFLHWVPMATRLANAEGKGGLSMLDLMVNSLRQRPDRILVGEIRRKKETEVAFEAIHTGHSVYGTFHANTADDAVTRLTSPPIEIPKTTLPGITMLIVQYRNRRSGKRRTFQFAEILPDGQARLLQQYDPHKDTQMEVRESKVMFDTISLFAGMTKKEINQDIKEKIEVLKWLAKNNINETDRVGEIMAQYYQDKENLLKKVRKNAK